jgi:hypothetical protein
MKKKSVLYAIFGVSWAWSSKDTVTSIQLWKKLLPDLGDDDLQDYPNEEIRKSKILDICAITRSENVNRDNAEEWLQMAKRRSLKQLTKEATITNKFSKQMSVV